METEWYAATLDLAAKAFKLTCSVFLRYQVSGRFGWILSAEAA
jgi:hypothetical protein